MGHSLRVLEAQLWFSVSVMYVLNHAWCLWVPEDGIRSPRIRVSDGCELPCGWVLGWSSSQGSPQMSHLSSSITSHCLVTVSVFLRSVDTDYHLTSIKHSGYSALTISVNCNKHLLCEMLACHSLQASSEFCTHGTVVHLRVRAEWNPDVGNTRGRRGRTC